MQAKPECYSDRDALQPSQLREDASKLIATIEESQFGFQHSLQGPYGPRRVIYTDYTASGKSLTFIEEYIRSEVLPTYANTHTTATMTGRQTTCYREDARDIIRKAVNCSGEDVVIFTGSGCTGAVQKLLHCLNLQELPQPPVVFISPFEHHANLLPWREVGADVVWVAEDSSGRTDIGDLEQKLKHYSKTGRQLIGSLNAASNITGVLTDTVSFSSLLHKYGALSFWDYATAAPYIGMDMNPKSKDLAYKDAIFFSMHKFVGGPETPGVLVAKKHLFHNSTAAPSSPAGGTVSFVTPTTHHYWRDIEVREEGGTPQIIGSIRAGLVMQLKEAVGPEQIEAIELACARKVLDRWSKIPELFVTGPHAVPKLPIFSIMVRHQDSGRFLHHNFVCSILNDVFGIQSRGGCMCAGPYAQVVLGIDEPLAQHYIMEGSNYSEQMREALKPGVTRIGFPFFMSEEAQDFVIEAVIMTAREGWKLLPQYTFTPETGSFCSSKTSCDQLKLKDVFYKNGTMTYPKLKDVDSPSFKEVLQEAQKLFDEARLTATSCTDLEDEYSSLLLVGKEMEEMRWFLLPYEAQLHLLGCPLPSVHIPFEPRNYESEQWRPVDYRDEWDRHWNPSYWKDTRGRSTQDGQWVLYPAAPNQNGLRAPTHLTQGYLLGTKRGSVSLTCLYSSQCVDLGSTGSLNQPSSFGGSGEVRWRKRLWKRRWGERKGKQKQLITFNQQNKCVVM